MSVRKRPRIIKTEKESVKAPLHIGLFGQEWSQLRMDAFPEPEEITVITTRDLLYE